VLSVFVHVFGVFRFIQRFRVCVFIFWVFSVFVCSVFLRVQYVDVCVFNMLVCVCVFSVFMNVRCVSACSVCFRLTPNVRYPKTLPT